MSNKINSAKTKDIIENKFKELVCQKPLSKVTVSEIIKECNINRKTFYYYFDDIYALLKQSLSREAINIVSNFDFQKEIDEAIAFALNYIENNHSFLKNIYYSVGRDELKRLFYGDFSDIIANMLDKRAQKNKIADSDFKDFSVKFYTEAIASTLVDAIVDYSNTDKDKIVAYLSRIINNSVL